MPAKSRSLPRPGPPRRTTSSCARQNGYDTAGGRARHHPLGRAEAAHRHRPRPAHRPAHPDPRRRHLQRGHGDRGANPTGPGPPDAGRTTFVIAHRLSTVHAGRLILVLEKARIAARGTHDELLRSSPLYAEIYRRQLQTPRGETLNELWNWHGRPPDGPRAGAGPVWLGRAPRAGLRPAGGRRACWCICNRTGGRLLLAFLAMLAATGLTLLIPYLTQGRHRRQHRQRRLDGLARIALVTAAAFVGLYATSAAAAVPARLGGAARAQHPARRPLPPPAGPLAGLPRHAHRRRDRLARHQRRGGDQRPALAGLDHPDRRRLRAGGHHRRSCSR